MLEYTTRSPASAGRAARVSRPKAAPSDRTLRMLLFKMIQFEYEPETLIESVKKRPGLWDYDNVDYRSKSTRHKLWLQVVREMAGEDVKVSKSELRELELQLQKKWKSIRDCFNKYITNPQRTKKPYVYYRHLEFLLKKYNRSRLSNEAEEGTPSKKCWKHVKKIKLTKMSSDEEEEQQEEYYAEDDVQLTNDTVKVEVTPQRQPIAEFAFANVEGSGKNEDDDADRMFLLSLLPHIKAVPEEFRLNVKMDLMQVLRNATNFHIDTIKGGENCF